MSEPSKPTNGIGGYLTVAVVTAVAVLSMTRNENQRSDSGIPIAPPSVAPVIPVPETTKTEVVPQPVATKSEPGHYYDSVEGVTYYYARAVSEEERKKGKRAPDMLSFWYLGRDNKGRDQIQTVIAGKGSSIAICGRPCVVIHYDDGYTVGFDEGSIIGGAFADAQRGYLKKRTTPNALPQPNPKPASEPAATPQSEPDTEDWD